MINTINGNTKRGQAIFNAWRMGEPAYSIRSIYGRYSYEKEKAFNYCYSKYCEDEGASDFRCTGHNSFAFSVAWMTKNNNIRYETASGSYLVLMNK